MNYYIYVLKNFAVFEGRARRKEYWMFFIFNLLFSFAFQAIDRTMGTVYLGLIYSLIVLVPSISVSVRRLHDTDRSGWWVLISLIPIVGFLILLFFMALDGQPGHNRYGSNPKQW
ncbi:DUF805 domain-containing protein [Vibrio hannami]|uniref:DUF805 domain-containing protein n=1 Tax=Vibrio hannami TaxID=2717094 RepID=UPI00240F4FF2|nr:DUF805 domain-containing protein [Vibrio hannami]MDG3088035.1 DUF805 domain-containing protein [Vibrio hannami]